MKTTCSAPVFAIFLALCSALAAGLGCDAKSEAAPSEQGVEQAVEEGADQQSAEGTDEAEAAKRGDELPEHLAPGEKKHFGAPWPK